MRLASNLMKKVRSISTTYLYMIAFATALIMTFIMTPLVKRLAFFVGAIDLPNERKVHTKIMPRLGGLAIFMAFIGGYFIISPAIRAARDYHSNAMWALLIGASIIVLIGALDDKYELSAKVKLFGQLVAATVVVLFGLKVELLNIPFGDSFEINMNWLSILITIAWIVGVTNAINLLDGLDGLAAGVSAIATATMFIIALMMGYIFVALLCAVLLGSMIGFLFFNFYPAKIFMGDSGALLLGFILATLSILGFKQAMLVSYIVPLLILGVPLADTFFSIVRRVISRKPISVADKGHLHHRLLQMGFGHRTTVLIIYGVAAIFGILAIVIPQFAQWVTVIIIIAILVGLQLTAEAIGIFSKKKKPLINFIRKVGIKTIRFLGTRTMK